MNPILRMTHPDTDGYTIFYDKDGKRYIVVEAVYDLACFSIVWLFVN